MSTNPPIYLDNNATTPCAPEVVEAMLPYFSGSFGNAASSHTMGFIASEAIENARKQVACTIGANPDEIIFTSGATESNNIVLAGLTNQSTEQTQLVTSTIEHKSLHEPVERISERGCDVRFIPVDADGIVDVDAAREIIGRQTIFVSIQGANNEIGTVQPVKEIADLSHEYGAIVHCDATQLLGKIPCSVDDLGVDVASFSAHKAYGPKGVGCLFVRRSAMRHLLPLALGGGQEAGLRPGTSNVPGVVGFGAACRLIDNALSCDSGRLGRLRDLFEELLLREITDVSINGISAPRVPGTSSVTIQDVPADALVAQLPLCCIGSGSACTSGAVSPSHVILALGRTREDARNTVRISIGRYNTEDDIRKASCCIINTVQLIRRKSDVVSGEDR